MTKVEVTLYFKRGVSYEVDVPEVTAVHIRNALLQKDPSDWTMDPDLYENLGSGFQQLIRDTTDEDLMKNSTVIDEHAEANTVLAYLDEDDKKGKRELKV